MKLLEREMTKLLRFPTVADSAPSCSEKPCEFCGAPRQMLAHGSFTYHKRCECAGARAARAAHEQQTAERAVEQRADKIDMLLNRAELNGGRAAAQSIGSFHTDTAFRENAVLWAERYVAQFEHGATWPVLYGTYGTGKTHIARAIAREIITQYQRSVLCINWLRWYQELKSDFKREKTMIGAVCATDLLVIDDFDKQTLTEYSQLKLYEIIDARYERCVAVLITANSSDLLRFLSSADSTTGGAIYDRLEEMAEWVEFAGESYRRRGNGRK